MRPLALRSHAVAGSYLVLLLALAGLAFATYRSAGAVRARMAHIPIYTVAEVRTQLVQHAGAWLGRPLLVRGTFSTCGPLMAAPIYCLAPDPEETVTSSAVDPLPLVWVAPTPLTALLGRIPLLRDLVPAPQSIHPGESAIYRIQLRVQTRQYCGAGVCYEALLPDAAL